MKFRLDKNEFKYEQHILPSPLQSNLGPCVLKKRAIFFVCVEFQKTEEAKRDSSMPASGLETHRLAQIVGETCGQCKIKQRTAVGFSEDRQLEGGFLS